MRVGGGKDLFFGLYAKLIVLYTSSTLVCVAQEMLSDYRM